MRFAPLNTSYVCLQMGQVPAQFDEAIGDRAHEAPPLVPLARAVR